MAKLKSFSDLCHEYFRAVEEGDNRENYYYDAIRYAIGFWNEGIIETHEQCECKHEWVDTGLMTPKLVCKHCNEDKKGE
jgi:hypothetical protein